MIFFLKFKNQSGYVRESMMMVTKYIFSEKKIDFFHEGRIHGLLHY